MLRTDGTRSIPSFGNNNNNSKHPVELKLANLSRKHKPNATWPKEKKIQAVAQYLALGNMRLVAATTGVSHQVLRQWKLQPWWKEYEREIRATENLKMDSDLTKIVERSLEAVSDRLDNGEVFYDQRSGELRRKPVSMKDAAKVSVDLLTKRELLRGNATSRTEAAVIPMADQLAALAAEFTRMSTGGPKITIDAEVTDVTPKEDDDAVYEESSWEHGTEESPWESGVQPVESSGTVGLHAGSESEVLPEEGGRSDPSDESIP